MAIRRPLVRVLGRTRQQPSGDVVTGVYPPYIPVYKTNGSVITLYRRDGIAEGVAAHIPVYKANGSELRVPTDSTFAITTTQAAGATRLVNAGVLGLTQRVAYQFANLAGFPAIGSPERLYVAADTMLEYAWSGNGYVLLSSVTVGAVGTTDDLPEGVTNLYFTVARVRATVLTGLSLATSTAIVAADTFLVAMGKLQAQITSLQSGKLDTTANAVSATKLVTARTINTVPFDGTANIAISNVTTGLEAGYGTNNGGSADWGANIWGMGPAYDGSGLNSSYTTSGQYGLAWLRASHAEADAQIGEGIYVYQNGVMQGGVGSAGTKTTGVFYGNGSGLTSLNASNLSSGTVPSGRLTGTYSISVTGNAGTATVLQTARTINGVSFNGSANITIPTGGVFSDSYVSANQAIGTASRVTLAHGLGGVPKLFYVRLVCVTAASGYSVGQEVDPAGVTFDRDQSTGINYTRGISVHADATSVYIQYSSSGDIDILITPGGGRSTVVASEWRAKVYAFI